ncbi:hypothetical protein ACEPAG_3927 [Sanghuangporus baumii]
MSCEHCGKRIPSQRGLTLHSRICKRKSQIAISLTDARSLMRDLRTQTAVAAAVVQDEPQDYPIVEDSPVDIYEEEPARTALFDEPAELPSGLKRKRALPKKF